MGVGPSAPICDLYLLYYEISKLEEIVTRIMKSDISLLPLIPCLVGLLRYMDDSIHIFPFPGKSPNKLYLANGGLYPKDIKISREQHDFKVKFLDLFISWKSAKRKSTKPRASLTWSLYEKNRDPKFSKLTLKRCSPSHTALPISIQLNIIHGECLRFADRCSRKRSFLFNLAHHYIEFSSQLGDLSLHKKINRAYNYGLIAVAHSKPQWNSSSKKLWAELVKQIFKYLPHHKFDNLIQQNKAFMFATYLTSPFNNTVVVSF